MIQKKIHYCWFGRGELNKKSKDCIASWKKFCPDYEIIEWNEDNFDVNMNEYTRFTYENKKYAFLSDYVRLVVVYQYGGIYFDVDVEVVKPFDELLKHEAFCGFETNEYVATGLGFGAVKGNEAIAQMIGEYDNLPKVELITCPQLNTKALLKFGLEQNGQLQVLDSITVYPIEVFNPYDDPTGRLNKTKNTYSIHWYAKSWMSNSTILRSKITKPFHRIFGEDCFAWLRR